jgi:hypothetical protein
MVVAHGSSPKEGSPTVIPQGAPPSGFSQGQSRKWSPGRVVSQGVTQTGFPEVGSPMGYPKLCSPGCVPRAIPRVVSLLCGPPCFAKRVSECVPPSVFPQVVPLYSLVGVPQGDSPRGHPVRFFQGWFHSGCSGDSRICFPPDGSRRGCPH